MVGDSTWFVGKGVEFVGKVNEAWFPSLGFEVIPEALAAPMVVALWAQLLVVADMRTGQHVATSAMISWPVSLV